MQCQFHHRIIHAGLVRVFVFVLYTNFCLDQHWLLLRDEQEIRFPSAVRFCESLVEVTNALTKAFVSPQWGILIGKNSHSLMIDWPLESGSCIGHRRLEARSVVRGRGQLVDRSWKVRELVTFSVSLSSHNTCRFHPKARFYRLYAAFQSLRWVVSLYSTVRV